MITPDSLFFRFTFHVLPWITYLVFALGVFFQVRKWLSGAPSVPEKKNHAGFIRTVKNLFLNLILQRRLLKSRKGSIILWITGWLLFHITLFFILVGHLRSVDVWSADWFTWLASKHFLTETLPLVMGYILLCGAVLLLLRRIVFAAPRSISTLGNYVVLLLIILVIASGDIMRAFPPEGGFIAVFPQFTVTIPPGITMELEKMPSLTWFSIHAFIAQITIMYIPFSGLIHIISGVVTISSRSRGK